MPLKIVELKAQMTSRTASSAVDTAGGGASASAAILERIKSNQSARGDSETCVFQGLSLDQTVVSQLQDMKEFRDMMPPEFASMGTVAGNGKDGLASTIPRRNVVVRSKAKPAHSGGGDGPCILIPVTSERIRVSDMKDALRDEYAARYCEHIGVAPSQQNMNLVLKLMPFEKCKISQTTQQNGIGRTERRNNVCIQPCVLAPPPDGPSAEDIPFELLTLEALKRVGKEPTDLPPTSQDVSASTVGRVAFEAYKNHFVYPYNLEERFATDGGAKDQRSPQQPKHNKAQSHRAPRPPAEAQSDGPTALQQLAVQDALLAKLRDQSELNGGGLTEDELSAIEHTMRPMQRAPSSSEEAPCDHGPLESDRVARRDAAAQKELTQPWTAPDVTEVRSLQVQFVKDFPFYRFAGRLSDPEVLDVKSTLLGDDIADLLISVMNFAHHVYVAPQAAENGRRLDSLSKDAEFILVCRKAIRLINARQRSPLAADALPVCILQLRVLVDALFTARYPILRRLPEGSELQQRMDALVRAMLDPYGLQSHIVVLESTPQAQRVLRTKRLPQRMSAAATTPLVQFIIGDGAKSTEAKRMTRSAQIHPAVALGLRELRQHLSPSVRAELLRVVTEERIQRDL